MLTRRSVLIDKNGYGTVNGNGSPILGYRNKIKTSAHLSGSENLCSNATIPLHSIKLGTGIPVIPHMMKPKNSSHISSTMKSKSKPVNEPGLNKENISSIKIMSKTSKEENPADEEYKNTHHNCYKGSPVFKRKLGPISLNIDKSVPAMGKTRRRTLEQLDVKSSSLDVRTVDESCNIQQDMKGNAARKSRLSGRNDIYGQKNENNLEKSCLRQLSIQNENLDPINKDNKLSQTNISEEPQMNINDELEMSSAGSSKLKPALKANNIPSQSEITVSDSSGSASAITSISPKFNEFISSKSSIDIQSIGERKSARIMKRKEQQIQQSPRESKSRNKKNVKIKNAETNIITSSSKPTRLRLKERLNKKTEPSINKTLHTSKLRVKSKPVQESEPKSTRKFRSKSSEINVEESTNNSQAEMAKTRRNTSTLIKSSTEQGKVSERKQNKSLSQNITPQPHESFPSVHKKSVKDKSGSSSSIVEVNNIRGGAPRKTKSVSSNEEGMKTPIWKKTLSKSPLFDFKSKRKSRRLSSIKNKDVYEFNFPASQEKNPIIKKRKKRKNNFKRKKVIKSSVIKSSMLTTDPSWKPPLSNSIPTNIFYSNSVKGKENCPTATHNVHDYQDEPQDDVPFDSHLGDDVDDAGYEASVSTVNETSSAFWSQSHANQPSILPSPRVTTARFPGVASTPRGELDHEGPALFMETRRPYSKQATVENDVELCFGFDEPEDESNIGLSPVKKVAQLSHLHAVSMVTHSNVEEIEPLPTRFAVKRFLPPPANSRMKSIPKITSNQRLIKKHKNLPSTSTKKGNIFTSIENQQDNINKSVLFDIEDEDNETNFPNSIPYSPTKTAKSTTKTTKLSTNTAKLKTTQISAFSPEKSFNKPPRKSYDRGSLEAVKRKFEREFAGGYPTTESDTEYEDRKVEDHITRRRRNATKKQPLAIKATTSASKRKPPQKTYLKGKKKKKPENVEKRDKENDSPPSDSSRKGSQAKQMDKQLTDWLSDVNSHFSEIEEMDLVIE